MSSPKEICFIIGMGRSGTTLLSKLLNQHPQVHATPEAVFLIFFLNAWKNKTSFSEADLDLLFEQIKWFSYTHPWAGWDFNPEKVKQETITLVKKGPVSYVELCKFIYAQFKVSGTDKKNATLLADKNPSYTLYTDKISRVFTQSKFIYIVRDYRANVLSRKENVDLRSPEVKLNAWLWNFFNGYALRFYRSHKDKVLLLRYEDLVENEAEQMKKIFVFLGLDSRAELQNKQYTGVKASEHTVPEGSEARFRKKYDDLNRPVNKDRLDAWKTGLTEDEIVACDSICGELGREFGYGVAGKTRSQWSYISHYLRAKKEVSKERLMYYLNPEMKLKRLKKVYSRLGYNRSK